MGYNKTTQRWTYVTFFIKAQSLSPLVAHEGD